MNALPNWHRIPLRAILLVTLAILAATTAIDRPAAAQNEDRLVRNLRVAPSDKQLDVSWDLPTNTPDLQIFIVRWRVKATTSTSDQNTTNATDTSYSITELDGDDLENGTEYEVAVQSIYTGGVGQPQTPWVTAIPNIGPLTTPAAPTSVQVAPGINSLDVTWTASQVTGNNAPTSYIVDWNPGPQQDAGTATSYTIPNLTAGTTYSVRVRAENGAGGAWSSSVNGVPVSGPKVTTIDIESFINSIATIRIYLANPDATQQTVYYCIIPTDRTCSGTEIQNTNTYSPHTSAFLIPMNLAENTTFIVSVSLDADMATNVKTARFTTLGPPDKLRLNVSPADGELYVTWSVDLNGGAPRGQILMWKLATATSFTDDIVGPANDARRYTITELNGTPLVNGTDYTVQISVKNEYGTATSDEVTRAPAPGPTVSDIASSNIEQTSATATVTVINLNLGNETVTAHLRYRVQGSTDDDDWSVPTTRTVSRSGNTANIAFNLTGLTGNTAYDVQALVTEGAETVDWTQSLEASLMTAPSPPHAPAFTVIHADGSLDVSWAAPTNKGGADITKYVLQWKSGAESYSSAREETADYDATADTVSNTEIAYANSVFSYTIPDLANGTAAEDTATPSTVPGTAPINILASECNSSIHLSWEGPTNTGGNPITSYTIQWTSGGEDFDDMATPERQVVTGTPDLMYTLESLTNGTQYSIRILATNINGDASHEVTDETTMVTTTEPIWSPVEIATPREAPCVSGIKFGKILADSAPIIVEVKDAEDGTIVFMQYGTVNDKSYKLQRKTVNAGDTTVTFDVRDLQPETEYVTEVFIGPGSTRFSAARAFFTSGKAPPDTTIRGGASFARILRIEPGIQNIVVSPGDRIRLDVNVYGRQGLLANDLADRAPTDGRPTFTWTSDRGGSFAEFGSNAAWRNSQADDRQVTFTAPKTPGTVEIKTALLASAECQPTLDDETAEDQIARCSATFNMTVRRLSAAEPQRPAPVNPPGTIPETLTDPEGTAYAVFTPRDGGNFLGDGYSFSAGAGAVANNEFIGISIAPSGDASNDVMTHHRYTLMGATYDIKVVDSSSEPVSDYVLQEPATVCLPLPNALRSNIADIAITAIGGDDSLTILATSVKITPDGVIVCAGISAIPATVAVGALGAPPTPPDIEPVETEQALPDTGGTAPRSATLILIMLLGMAATTCALIARRRITKGM